jgi:ATP-dependent Zn protease
MELTAYHEAGHAFMATVLGAKVESVTIDPDNDDGPERYGDTQIIWKRSRLSDREWSERAILVSLAGPVSEMLYSGDPFHPGLVAEWANDWQSAWDLAEPFFPSPRRRLEYLETVTAQLYQRLNSEPNWSAVAAIADSLLAHEMLEHEEIEEIVKEWID